jgi:hypothetical protein
VIAHTSIHPSSHSSIHHQNGWMDESSSSSSFILFNPKHNPWSQTWRKHPLHQKQQQKNIIYKVFIGSSSCEALYLLGFLRLCSPKSWNFNWTICKILQIFVVLTFCAIYVEVPSLVLSSWILTKAWNSKCLFGLWENFRNLQLIVQENPSSLNMCQMVEWQHN